MAEGQPLYELSDRAWSDMYNDMPVCEYGHASSLNEEKQVVVIKHILGFRRDDWGEGNWTAGDLR